MTQSPFNAAALRGAVDLSGLKKPAGSAATSAAGADPSQQIVVEGSDATFQAVVESTMTVPALVVLWSGRLPQSADFVEELRGVVLDLSGRLRLVTVDVDRNPGLLQAFGVESVPMTAAVIKGQPVPLFAGAYPREQLGPVLDQVLQLAAQQGVTGTVAAAPEPDQDGAEPAEAPLAPLHEKAFEAIEAGDLDGAAAAYREALADNPGDHDAALGLSQVALLQRTTGADPAAVRAAAAADPQDIDAALACADLDVLGGHIEDGFTRLIDLVRVTAGEERDRVRARLLELFNVVGNHDERVRRGRTALMSALF